MKPFYLIFLCLAAAALLVTGCKTARKPQKKPRQRKPRQRKPLRQIPSKPLKSWINSPNCRKSRYSIS